MGNSNFLSFIKKTSKQADKGINDFIDYVKENINTFPRTTDLEQLAFAMHNRLTPLQTIGFQKMILMYFELDSKQQLDEIYKMNPSKLLEDVNLIIEFQDRNPNYKFNHLLPNKK
ncbi:MAG: hypothetical protein GQ574_22995 [Crocinitomix sp.]|nr:hypothetical protein [Crocinitomix sp.]